jgi:hypothetical protein
MINKKEITIHDEYGNLGYSSDGGTYVSFNLKNGGVFDNEYFISDSDTCREEFEYSSFRHGLDIFGWQKTNIDIELINEFFSIIEKKLALKDKLVFSKTNHKNLIAISNISKFWQENSIRRGFLTLFLRASNYYNGKDFSRCFDAYGLASSIKPAIEHFLKGNINVLNYEDAEGVVDYFEHRSIGFINENLVGKNFKPKKLSIYEKVLTEPFKF